MAAKATLLGVPDTRFSVIEHHEELDSSNAELLRRVAGGSTVEGIVLLVDHQTAGRGRSGRTWLDDGRSTLMFSTAVNVGVSEASLVPLVVGLAVRDAVAALVGDDRHVGLKWPNDVEVDGRKLAGILVEAAAFDDDRVVAVIGAGVNLGWVGERPPEVAARATDLARLGAGPVDGPVLLRELLGHLERGLASLADDAAGLLATYRGVCVSIGRRVRLATPGGDVEGTVVDVADDGRLVLGHDGGSSCFSAGDVHHLPV